MNKGRIIAIHLIIWVTLSLTFFMISESLTNLILPEIHGVELWLTILLTGLILIFVGVMISLMMKLIKMAKKQTP
jgi:uncharacterized membrane protein YgaE (UPF0421/DUF939 family)